jgi:predicted deacylase
LKARRSYSTTGILTARQILRCGRGGIVVQKRNPYDLVHAGEIISVIMNPYGETLEEVRAPVDLYILSLKEDAVVQAGERVAFVGLLG